MADPFSIFVGALSLAQACVSVTKLLKSVKDSYSNVRSEAEDAIKELSGLKEGCESVQDVCQKVKKEQAEMSLSNQDSVKLAELCGRLSQSVEDCKEYMNKLQLLFTDMFGPTNAPVGYKASFRSTSKQLSKNGDLLEIRRKVSTHRSNIQNQMIALSSYFQMIQISHTDQSLTTITIINNSVQLLQSSMHSVQSIVDQFLQPIPQSTFQPSLFSVRSTPLVDGETRFVGTRHSTDPSRLSLSLKTSAIEHQSSVALGEPSSPVSDLQVPPPISNDQDKEEVSQRANLSESEDATPAHLNKFFNLPHHPVANFIGRSELLMDIVADLKPTTPNHTQKRSLVIISGMGGVGKTQLAIHAAQTLRKYFFGIFSINASIDQQVRAGLEDIASIFGLEKDSRVACNYLAALQRPWLLLIEDLHIDTEYINHISPGNFGSILITTRDPKIQNLGTIRGRALALEGLSTDDGVELLLSEACFDKPYSISDLESASEIASSLGNLPLALTMAAGLIRRGLCSLTSYLDMYRSAESRMVSNKHENLDENIYVTLDVIAPRLDGDAFRILEILACLHYEDIPVDIFRSDLLRERYSTGSDSVDVDESLLFQMLSRLPLFDRLYPIIRKRLDLFWIPRYSTTYAALPRILRAASISWDSSEVLSALETLASFALVRWNRESNMLSIHRVIQEWVVRRGFSGAAQKAIACESAILLLTNCISLWYTFAESVEFVESRYLLPHIVAVNKFEAIIRENYRAAQQKSRSWRPQVIKYSWSTSTSAKSHPFRLMKLSLIYFSGGEYKEACRLQEEARHSLVSLPKSIYTPQCVHVSFALARTYHRLHLHDKAVDLQCQTIQACEVLYGKEHNTTLKMTDMLGLYYLSRGDLSQSLSSSQEALAGLEKLHQDDPQHKTTLAALNHLGAAKAQHYMWKESKQLCDLALKGLEQVEPDGKEVWFARQNVAIANINLGDEGLIDEAENLMEGVYNHWKRTLGEEHPNTILAVFNMCRVLLCRDRLEEAESLLLPTLQVAKTRLDTNDFGLLNAHVLLACIKLRQRSYDEAEKALIEANDKYTETGVSGDHMDRIVALWYLMECYKEQYRFGDAMDIHDEISDSIKTVLNFNLRLKHPLAKSLNRKRQELEALKQQAKIATQRVLEEGR